MRIVPKADTKDSREHERVVFRNIKVELTIDETVSCRIARISNATPVVSTAATTNFDA